MQHLIVGAAENGWDRIFDGKRHQVAVHVSTRRIQFYYNCEKKGGNFLTTPRELQDDLQLNIVTTLGKFPKFHYFVIDC